MAGKTKPGSALKGINIKLKIINDLMDVTGSAKDSWNPAEISDDMKAIAYIHRLADTWNPAQLNEALKYLGFATIDSWNPAIIEETKNKLVKYFLPTEATGNPITFNTYGNLPYEVSKAEVTFLPKQSGSGEPSHDNVRPISGWTEVNLYVDEKQTLSPATTYTETLGQTVYGGKVDFVSGEVQVDLRIISENDFATVSSSGTTPNGYHWADVDIGYIPTFNISNMLPNKNGDSGWGSNVPCFGYVTSGTYKYMRVYCKESTIEDFKTAYAGLQIVFSRETPATLTLTPTEIELLKGKNVIWTDGDDILIEYKALLNS